MALLLLLFALAIYMLYTSGFSSFALVCMAPLFFLVLVMALEYRMFVFWVLMLVNFFVQWKNFPSTGLPLSIYNEMIELLLIGMAIVKVEEDRFGRLFNLMFFALGIWFTFCVIEILNDTCGLGMNLTVWYTGARLMAFQMMYAFVVFTLYVTTPRILMRYLLLWAGLSLFAALWIWKQKYIGMTDAERAFLYGAGRTTHIINAGYTIRYFSVFSDAANYGVYIASAAVAFIVFGITSRQQWLKLLFLVVGATCLLAIGPSGTRTAIACFLAGAASYVFLSKSVRLAVPMGIFLALLFFFLAFTKIGNSNGEIRRMRSAFSRSDASVEVRYTNQAVMRKYLVEAPWGIGLGNSYEEVPPNNKFARLCRIPPDSDYVYIWIHTGYIGITVFLCVTGLLLLGACHIIYFRLTNRTLVGIAAGMTSAFIAYQVGSYANQVLMQFPNCLIFYGAMSIVYALPGMEAAWNEYEAPLLEKQEEKKRLRREKRLASRV